MRYSIEPKERIYVKGYGVLSFAKIMDKNLSSKFGQKHLHSAKKFKTDAIKNDSKTAIEQFKKQQRQLLI